MDRIDHPPRLTRRDVMLAAGSTLGLAGLGMSGIARKFALPQGIAAEPLASSTAPLDPTPACLDADDATDPFEEGPYYAANSPERTDLRGAKSGQTILVSGQVRDTACRPIAGAVVDLWHADPDGEYDNVGYEHRGHLFTDAEGRYSFVSTLPNHYWFAGLWRARHIHLKAQGAGTRVLTTQMFFPLDGESNARHAGFNPKLLASLRPGNDGALHVGFDLVLENRA